MFSKLEQSSIKAMF
ncbi:hypothetical protein [Escherichia coli]|nr:hypothetical protein [Escherichia coli]EIQ0733831.1 hypothetical protein [Escherichia coli]MBN6372479.1 hypothetical protein [Escherichia coli]MDA7079571.1 hypothetical protein [Escherichia coli]HBN7145564.1 hypothetical protein [Escherichia coli]HBQ4243444.1 hypothetical protein [Escherichia coli]